VANILIVEDHDGVRSTIRSVIGAMFPSCAIFEASTGEDALQLSKECPPHVVIMDISLPGMDGIEATRQIKALEPRAKVVILTVHDAEEYRTRAKEAGACSYIVKSRASRDLLTTMHSLLNNSTAFSSQKAQGRGRNGSNGRD
jgi:DNA-binding NarL/FixJ family response regulator